jgi:putative transcriptional regulator
LAGYFIPMDSNVDYFKIEHNNVSPAVGKVLISEPFLQDIYFKRSVVLLTSQEEGHFVGFVLNKFTNISIHETVRNFPKFESLVSVGGPVKVDNIHFIHSLGERIPESLKILDNLWWGGDFNVLKDLISAGEVNPNEVRFFLGYSGWEPNQLEREITENSWLVWDLDAETIMNSSTQLWKETLGKLGDKYKLWAGFPEDPSFN